ncbi:MAG: leucine-rich repeat domain-containing protein [Bacteroidales bacterium]|jgi:Leucine-rich repeat (LRR) protein|nr:leucine-rich repeat domain-containing protein [Bacteroidales bacterium]
MKQNVFLAVCISILCSLSGISQEREFTSLEEAMLSPDSVFSLTLRKSHLKAIPSEIYTLKHLKRLSLSRNNITEISDSIALLRELHYLDLSSNNVSSLPPAMATLPIDTLILWDNPIYALDTSFAALPLLYLDMRAITQTKKEQDAIISLFPKAKIRRNRPCNCGR